MSEPRVPARAAEIPSSIVFGRSDRDVAKGLAETLGRLDLAQPLVAFGERGRALLGSSLLIDLGPKLACRPLTITGGTVEEAERLRDTVRDTGADVVVAVGGGRTIDVAKYASHLAGVAFVAVPTQASHDGICSPVSVLRGPGDARASSYGARPPGALVVPLHAITAAPRDTIMSGIADLASNILAVKDWEWARQFHGDEFDDYAALLARSAAELMIGRRDLYSPERPFDDEDVEVLVHGLALSGLAMTIAGSSRPCSGPEHLISHSFDWLGLGTGSHGQQVSVGAALAARFYDAHTGRMLELLERIGAPLSPDRVGIGRDDALRAVGMAHLVRPDRHSRLSAALVADPEFVMEQAEAAWFR
jgi:glycerol-1-phosphate dehydrogenase [NAD(P)+]